MNFWLFKTEPDDCSIDDLAAAGGTGLPWDGIRNYQARNFLRDEVQEGDRVLIYHSSCAQVGLAGIARVIRGSYVDPDQFDPNSSYYDSKATADNPRWYCVDIAFTHKFSRVIRLAELKNRPELASMVLLRQGRLSVQPVSSQEWGVITKLAGTVS